MKNISDELEKVATKRVNITEMNEIVVRLADVKNLLSIQSNNLKETIDAKIYYFSGDEMKSMSEMVADSKIVDVLKEINKTI